jgi:superoxide dismutase, Cu-Zn family
MKIALTSLLLSLTASATLVAQDNATPATDTPPLTAAPGKPTSEESADAEKHGDMELKMPTLAAVLTPTKGNETRGVVTFEPLEDNQVRVSVRLSGLKPDAKHAMHIHEFGDVSSEDGTSAGGHFNPAGKAHGLPDSEERHAGDFGNLESDADGNANQVLTIRDLSLIEGDHAIIGRALIVHAGEDKGTQPSGDAGDRIAQGVIAIANPASMKSGVATEGEDESETTVSSVDGASKPAGNASMVNRPVATPTETTADKISRGTEAAVRTTAKNVEQGAEKLGEGAEKAARTTVKAVERGVEEVGGALKKVGRKIEDAVE